VGKEENMAIEYTLIYSHRSPEKPSKTEIAPHMLSQLVRNEENYKSS
jgi:hypothetical protein